MKFTVGTERGGTVLRAEPVMTDAHPEIPVLRTDLDLGPISNDRLAVACTLAFLPWMSGETAFPKPVSTLTARVVGELEQDRWHLVESVEHRNLPLSGGEVSLRLVLPGREAAASAPLPPDGGSTLSCEFAAIDIGGRTSSMGRRLSLASNASVVSSLVADPALKSWPFLAVAVLHAERLGAGTLVLEEAGTDREQRIRLSRLLACCGLGADFR